MKVITEENKIIYQLSEDDLVKTPIKKLVESMYSYYRRSSLARRRLLVPPVNIKVNIENFNDTAWPNTLLELVQMRINYERYINAAQLLTIDKP